MDRIQHPSATSSHQFTEGDPGSGVPATTVTATWLNGLQEELVHLIEQAGITPSASILTQVKAALDALYSGDTEVAALAADLAAEIVNRTNADASLANNVSSALTTLSNQLTTETNTRTSADTNLSGMISAETNARTVAAAAETAARVAGDVALDVRVDALEATVPGAALLAGDNVLSGKNTLQKVLALGRATMGENTPGSTPSFPISLDTPPTLELVGAVIFLTGYLVPAVTPPLRVLIMNPSGYTWGVNYPVTLISAVGVVTNYTASDLMLSAKMAELVWTGEALFLKAWSV